MENKFLELDLILSELEGIQEKVTLICDDLANECFCFSNTKHCERVWDRGRIKNDILFDYLQQTQEKIKELRTAMNL